VGRFQDQVVLITGAARGQGRAHAVGLAAEGARIVALDACEPMRGVRYPMASMEDLEETGRLVKDAGGDVITAVADVRSQEDLDAAVASTRERFGRLDHVVANAGVFTGATSTWEMSEEEWDTTIDIDLSGVWRTCKAAIPLMLDTRAGGSITITASSNGYRAEHGHPSYNAAKLGVVALMRTLAGELGEHSIRVNTVHPTVVKTDMMWNDYMVDLFAPGQTMETMDPGDWWDGMRRMNLLPLGAVDPSDITAVIAFLASEAGRHITGSEIPVDAGYIVRN
jgi:(+)-trans-carveol dehydrogenase